LKTKIISSAFVKTLKPLKYSAGVVVVNSEVVELAPGMDLINFDDICKTKMGIHILNFQLIFKFAPTINTIFCRNIWW
jgi:hypothetical protein